MDEGQYFPSLKKENLIFYQSGSEKKFLMSLIDHMPLSKLIDLLIDSFQLQIDLQNNNQINADQIHLYFDILKLIGWKISQRRNNFF